MNNYKSSRIARLNDLGVIHVFGEDAKTFLQNLITADIKNLSFKETYPIAQLSGYCTAQGRLTASFWISTTHPTEGDHFLIWISKDVAEYFVKRLKMFVLRSKVKIEYQLQESIIFGFIGEASEFNHLTSQRAISDFIELPAVKGKDEKKESRFIFIPTEQFQIESNASDIEYWNLLEVLSGIPRVTQATVDKFVPQMINFESVGGINFQKGCYPGQEVVARSQYRGTIKRRLFIMSMNLTPGSELLIPGAEIYDANEPNQPVGMVVLSSFSKLENKIYLQVELKLDSVDKNLAIFINERLTTMPLSIEDLPYELAVI